MLKYIAVGLDIEIELDSTDSAYLEILPQFANMFNEDTTFEVRYIPTVVGTKEEK